MAIYPWLITVDTLLKHTSPALFLKYSYFNVSQWEDLHAAFLLLLLLLFCLFNQYAHVCVQPLV